MATRPREREYSDFDPTADQRHCLKYCAVCGAAFKRGDVIIKDTAGYLHKSCVVRSPMSPPIIRPWRGWGGSDLRHNPPRCAAPQRTI